MVQLNFDASQFDNVFDTIPDGWYIAQIKSSEMKPNSKLTGSYLNLELEIVEGEHKGRILYDILNIDNPNKTAQEIAYKTLASICHATGVIKVENAQELHAIPMEIKVRTSSADDEYDARNIIKGYRGLNNGESKPQITNSVVDTTQETAKEQQKPGNNPPPWG